MEKILCIDENFPMSLHCVSDHIEKYHNLIKNNNVPTDFTLDSVVEEKAKPDGTLLFRVKWKDWPSPQYDTWESYACVTNTDALHEFRRKSKKQVYTHKPPKKCETCLHVCMAHFYAHKRTPSIRSVE